MKKDPIGDRMKKNYENRARTYLTRRTPVIIRLDGKAFHTLTRDCEKPFDDRFGWAMQKTGSMLVHLIQGCLCAYVQSDEISLLLTDYRRFNTEAWFDYNLQKIVSVSAAMATAYFNEYYDSDRIAFFDSRAFNLPREEVNNYFVWRQKDWIRNSTRQVRVEIVLCRVTSQNYIQNGKFIVTSVVSVAARGKRQGEPVRG